MTTVHDFKRSLAPEQFVCHNWSSKKWQASSLSLLLPLLDSDPATNNHSYSADNTVYGSSDLLTVVEGGEGGVALLPGF